MEKPKFTEMNMRDLSERECPWGQRQGDIDAFHWKEADVYRSEAVRTSVLLSVVPRETAGLWGYSKDVGSLGLQQRALITSRTPIHESETKAAEW